MRKTKYNGFTTVEARTLVTRQALWLLDTTCTTVKQQAYIQGEVRLKVKPTDIIRSSDVDKILENAEYCCLGLLALARIRRMPELTWADMTDDFATFCKGRCTLHASRESVISILRPLFFRKQLDCIETAFEGGLGYLIDTYLIKPEYEEAINFGELYTDPKNRASAIIRYMLHRRNRMFDPVKHIDKYRVFDAVAA